MSAYTQMPRASDTMATSGPVPGGRSVGARQSVSASAVCILNAAAHSDKAQECRDELGTLFEKHARPVDFLVARKGGDLVRLARDAVSRGSKLVIAGGGDGTINAVAGAVVGSDAALGVLPLGTLNHFAKDLNIPLALADAVDTALNGREIQVDVGEVNGAIFLNNSSLGLYPGLVVRREALQREGHGKWRAFAHALGHTLRRYSPLTVHVKLDGETIPSTTPFIFIGNNRYSFAAPHVGERKALDEGRLWIYQAPHATRADLLRLAIAVLAGKANTAELVERDASQFEIRASARSLRVATDGEVTTMASPLHYRILPRALRVMVPANDGA